MQLLTHLFPMHPFSTPWCFQEKEEGGIGNKWVNVQEAVEIFQIFIAFMWMWFWGGLSILWYIFEKSFSQEVCPYKVFKNVTGNSEMVALIFFAV